MRSTSDGKASVVCNFKGFGGKPPFQACSSGVMLVEEAIKMATSPAVLE
jgi:hypothetical protein